MREIKFRAWKNNFHGKGDWRWSMSYQDIYGLDEYFGLLRSCSDYKLMQYTGLKDKNGTEIYEGDIVKAVGKYDYKFKARQIEFIDGAFKVIGYGLCAALVEVIGNIYENPELLEASK